MKLPNLKELMISLTDFKKEISDIINKNKTKVIVRNNEPVSIFMPYSEYISDSQRIKKTGKDITLNNGVQAKVTIETKEKEMIIRTYVKMKTTGEYKLHFTHSMSNPSIEQTLTPEELKEYYETGKVE